MPHLSSEVDVSIVMPCLNEVRALPTVLENARSALDILEDRFGLVGEIVLADNGSTDGSREVAARSGARVVAVAERGYGAALGGGFGAARGRYLVMGDADGSYDFRDAVPMVEALRGGADLCMGSRFRGGIAPGAMPWKNRYIGNPILTGLLNALFGTAVDDAHCGLRALTKGCFKRLDLRGRGMEFASEMVVKAALKGETIAEVPATLSPDLRDRPPHLRPWRDGWRHLRFLLMLSPAHLFAWPALLLVGAGLTILTTAALASIVALDPFFFGSYWIILAGALLGLGHSSGLLALASHLYGIRQGYRRPGSRYRYLEAWVSLESMLLAGATIFGVGLSVLCAVVWRWSARDFLPFDSVLPAVTGTTCLVVGAQNFLGGFLLAILGGNEAEFLRGREPAAVLRAEEWKLEDATVPVAFRSADR